MMLRKGTFLLLILVVAMVSATFARTWKSNNGTHSIDAEFAGLKDGEVSLRKSNGNVIQVPISRLCDKDQAYVAEQVKSNDSPPPSTTETSSPLRQWNYQKLVRSANCLRSASEVLRLYKMFLQDKNITKVDRKAAEKQLPTWEDRANKKMVRIGLRWLTPEEAKDQKLQARQLVAEAGRLIEVKQFGAAVSKLRKASKIDEESLRADFLLGLGYALIDCDAKKANRHFRECIRRDPQHISALNNLALSEVRLKKHTRALSHWRMALELAPASPEAIQNLGRLLNLLQQRRLHVPSQVQSQFTDLYAMASVAADAKDFNRRTGWLYMGYYASFGEKMDKTEEARLHATHSKTSIATMGFCGTGFVVSPEYILTNHHVIENSTEISVVLPGEGNRKLPARVVGVANNPEDNDLAIIHCKGLEAPPVHFIKADLAPRGTEIMILGFPGILEGNLISTRGTIAGQPDKILSRYTMDATANGGNSGGPVCDETGNVLGILVSGTSLKARLPMNYTFSIPHSRALPLLKKCIPSYRQLPPNAEVKNWADVDGVVSRSTVRILVKCPLSNGGINADTKPKQIEKSRALEDPWCMRCSGRGVMPCPNRKCNKGNVNVKRTVVDAVDPATGRKLYGQKFFRTECPTCHGKGTVSCPDCRGGIDKSLL